VYTILIADDNAAIRASVRTCILENLEAHVCGEAENGAEAVEKVKELSPDVVILDFQMPVLYGLRAAAQIRSLAPDTKIILFTMYASKQMMNYAQMFGVDQVISKTDGAGELLAAVQAASRN
jgi:DNA-binding NarL/FixJ family response regulator